MVGIYKITNIKNNKVYIGQSTNIKQRWALHKSELRHKYHENIYLQNAWNKYGEDNFDFSIVEECDNDKDILDDRETFWINYYRSFDRENGYNILIQGGSGLKLHPILQFDLSGIFIKEWDNVISASNALNIAPALIYGCTSQRYKNAGKYIWIFKDKYTGIVPDYYFNNQVYKKILQYDLEGNLIHEWPYLKIAKDRLGYIIHISTIDKPCTCNGYIFIYENDAKLIDKNYFIKTSHLLNNICNKPFYQVDKECNIIKEYNCLREAEEIGYNERMISECYRNLRNSYKGYIWILKENYKSLSIEKCKQLLSKSKPISLPVQQYDLKNKLINEYEKLEHVKKDGYSPVSVGDCCKGRKKQYKGFIWKYKD